MMAQINKDLLSKIDNLELSDRIRRWQKAMKACPGQIYVDRQGGFSAYFVQLSPEVQDDIILRTEQSL
jgi:hypothetical protein